MVASPAKRKINDFFLPSAKKAAIKSPSLLNVLQCTESQPERTVALVPGLSLQTDFIGQDEEQQLLDFLNDTNRCKWRTDLSRRTMHFGGTYCLMTPKSSHQSGSKEPEIIQAPPMPTEFAWLIERMVAANIIDAKRIPQYCIVNEYIGSQGISAHTENIQFSEPVIGLSLLSEGQIRFTEMTKPYDGSVRSGRASKAAKTGNVKDVRLPGRSLLVMRGESRWKWQHEIPRSRTGRGPNWKRVSLTFRHKEGQERRERR